MSDKGKRMVELSKASAFTDAELAELIDWYHEVIDFLDGMGGRLVGNALRLQVHGLELARHHRETMR